MSQTKISISNAQDIPALVVAIKDRFASYKAPSVPFKNGQMLECAVYATAKTQAFEAGNSGSEVYRLRTNWCLNGAAFKAAVVALLAKQSTLTVDEMRDEWYDLVSIHTVNAQIWDNNPDLTKLLNYGSASNNAAVGILSLEEFTTKDGVDVSTFRLNRVSYNGVAVDEGVSMSLEDTVVAPAPIAAAPLPTPVPVPAGAPAPGLDPNHMCKNGYTVAALRGAGWSDEQLASVM
jgi:hypothetical protein